MTWINERQRSLCYWALLWVLVLGFSSQVSAAEVSESDSQRLNAIFVEQLIELKLLDQQLTVSEERLRALQANSMQSAEIIASSEMSIGSLRRTIDNLLGRMKRRNESFAKLSAELETAKTQFDALQTSLTKAERSLQAAVKSRNEELWLVGGVAAGAGVLVGLILGIALE